MRILIDDSKKLDHFLNENDSYELILVKFSTKWCLPCKKMQTIIDEFEKERKDVLILEIDAERSFSISQDSKFNVLSVPTLFLFRNGKIIKRIEGYINLDSLRNIFNTII